jgi:hypothetical protein
MELLTKKCQENQEQVQNIMKLLKELDFENTVNTELEKEKDKNKILEDENKNIRQQLENCKKEIDRYKSNPRNKKPLSPKYYDLY